MVGCLQKTTLIAPQTSSSTPNHNIIEHQTSFLPVTLQPEPNQEQITPVTVSSPTLTGIQLQIPNDNKTPISLSIEQIDTYSLIELLRGLQ